MLNKLADNVWLVEGQCVDFHGFPYPTRSVIVRFENGELWVWSPIAISEELAESIKKLGSVQHLVSPNKLHHLYLSEWKEKFPEALLWGPKTTQLKRADLNFEPALSDVSPCEWNDEFELFHVQGSFAMDEILFRHKKSKTLVVADFAENFEQEFLDEHWRSWQRWVAKRWGIVVGKGYAPLDWRMSFLRRAKVKKIRQELLSCDIKHVIMAHGEVQYNNGIEFLEKSLEWV